MCIRDSAEILGKVLSPDKSIEIDVEQDNDGRILYSVSRYGNQLVSPSVMAFLLKGSGRVERGLEFKGAKTDTHNETWELPWGESRYVVDNHNELKMDFIEKGEKHRSISVTFRAFNDGIGFRYSFPDKNMGEVQIEDEMTEFNIAPKSEALWIPAGEPNRYEQLYRKTPLSEVTQAHTPITIKTKDGIYMSFHEASLVNYSSMWLRRTENQTLRTQLAPGPDGVKAVSYTHLDVYKRQNTAYGFKFLYADELTKDLVIQSLNEWNNQGFSEWPSYAFSNHDAPRAISRWAKGRDLGDMARFCAILLASLRGNIFIYQGEELGLEQADVPFERLVDPEAIKNWPKTLGRDGARTPMTVSYTHLDVYKRQILH